MPNIPDVLAKKYTITDPQNQASDIDDLFDDLYRQLTDAAPTGDAGDIFIADEDGVLFGLPLGTNGAFLRAGTDLPEWSTLILPNTAAKGDILYASATDNISRLAAVAQGQVILSQGLLTAPIYTSSLDLVGASAQVSLSPSVAGRDYIFGYNDASGGLDFSRSDALQKLRVILSDTAAVFTASQALGTDVFQIRLTGGTIVLTPADGGGNPGKVQFGRRISDDSAAVGAIAEFWIDNAETLPIISTMTPGGATRRFQVMPNADILQMRDEAQSMNIRSLSELTTIAAAAFTDTTIQFPANSLVLGVSVRVTVAIPTAATFDVGDPTTATLFNAGVAVAANTTASNPPSAYTRYTAATKVRITPNLTPAANTGRVRVTIHYIDFTAPTS